MKPHTFIKTVSRLLTKLLAFRKKIPHFIIKLATQFYNNRFFLQKLPKFIKTEFLHEKPQSENVRVPKGKRIHQLYSPKQNQNKKLPRTSNTLRRFRNSTAGITLCVKMIFSTNIVIIFFFYILKRRYIKKTH